MTNYKQLQEWQRHLIDFLLNQENKSLSQIVQILKKMKIQLYTIVKEVKQNKLQKNIMPMMLFFIVRLSILKNVRFQ